MGELSGILRSQRELLVTDLAALTPAQWATPSLCPAWTVQQVAAHLAWAPAVPPLEGVTAMVRTGFRVNRTIADLAVRWAGRGVPAILDQLRTNARTGARPTAMPEVAALADAVVHGLDVRRPLGLPQPLTLEELDPVAGFLVTGRWPMTVPVGGAGRRRFRGLRLVAEDLDWSRGEGAEVRGPAEAILLLLSGRRAGEGELTGPGVAHLRST